MGGKKDTREGLAPRRGSAFSNSMTDRGDAMPWFNPETEVEAYDQHGKTTDYAD